MSVYQLHLAPFLSEIPRLHEWLASCGRADGLDNAIASRLALAVEEAVANVIAHAFAGRAAPHRLDLRLAIAPSAVVVEIVDNGRPFDPTATPAPDLAAPIECREPGGLGIHLMRTLIDRLDYRRDDDANVLRLEMMRR